MSLLEVNEISPKTGTTVAISTGKTLSAPTFTVPSALTANSTSIDFSAAVTANLRVLQPIYSITSAVSIPIDFSQSNYQSLILGHDPTFTFSNLVAGTVTTLFLDPDGSARTLTWPGGVKWAGGSPLTSLSSGNIYEVIIAHTGTETLLKSTLYS